MNATTTTSNTSPPPPLATSIPRDTIASTANPTKSFQSPLSRYALAFAVAVAAHLLAIATNKFIGPAIYTLYLAAVVIAALYGGRGPGLLATAIVSLELDYTFMQPYKSLALNFENFLYLCAFLCVALLTSSLQARRRRAEESLRAAHDQLESRVRERTAQLLLREEQLSLLVNGSPDQAFFQIDEHGTILSWNAGAQRLLGYPSRQILGSPLAKLWPESHRMEIFTDSASRQKISTPERSEYHDWITRNDGTRLWASIVLNPIEDSSQQSRGWAVTMRDITDRKSLERDVLEISEREQERIGHDLHDGIGQELTGVALLCTALADQLQDKSIPEASEVSHAADLVRQTIRHTRALAHGLSPMQLENQDFAAAIRQLADQITDSSPNSSGVQCSADTPATLDIDPHVALHLYRIAQEAIANAVRHGKAKNISITLHHTTDRLTLTIHDDGSGLPPASGEQSQSAPTTRGSGMGLRLMHYRAKAIRGSLDVRPRSRSGTPTGPQNGTVVQCTVDAFDRNPNA